MRGRALLPLSFVVAISGCLPELPAEKPQDGDTAGDCGDLAGNDDGVDENCNGLRATVDMTCHGVDTDADGTQDPVTSVRLVGPWWEGWAPDGGPDAVDNGDGTWTVLFGEAPTEAMEYLWSVNLAAPYEDLVDDMQAGGTCAPITDYSGYANRQWAVGSGEISDTYASCSPCGG